MHQEVLRGDGEGERAELTGALVAARIGEGFEVHGGELMRYRVLPGERWAVEREAQPQAPSAPVDTAGSG